MAHRVTLKPSGHTYEVEDGKTVLQAGLDAGHMLPYSCRAGVCRTCRGTVVEGKVDYGLAHETYLPQERPRQGLRASLPGEAARAIWWWKSARSHGVRPRIIPCRVERLDKPAPMSR